MPRSNDVAQEDPILGHGGRIGQRSPDMGVNAPFYHQPIRGPRVVNASMMNFIRSRHHPRQGDFQQPQLNYTASAPGILGPVTPPIDAAALRNVDYKTPPPPKQGFTRSPKETDVLLCAQCDQELGVESDTPKASEVWTGKCGHCYCGGCAMAFRAPPSGVSTSKRPRKYCSDWTVPITNQVPIMTIV
ncbi:hypothetical protein BDD12DRAFT_803069 [Trichophaea hybrida]|nr:hypothetical protein BDD12DRAFT_803069 [Trichophaea hybrida]